jgi:hypothetical protein
MLPINAPYPQSPTRYEQLLVDLADGIDPEIEYQQKDIWQPSPENAPQQMAYDLAASGEVMEIGYGGQAGGGKTDLTLGLAGTLFERSLIMRREFPQLNDVILRGDEIYPVGFVSGSKKRWQFDNRIIGLGSAQHAKDWKKYQGRSIGLLAFDEAAEFPESIIRNISGWIRAPKGKHTLLLLCFNPPTTPEGEWIVQRFAPWIAPDYPGKQAQPGEIRWFARIDDKEIEVDNGEPFYHGEQQIYPISRTFIPASRHDNPFLDLDYERRLDNLPEPLRTMVKDGDFTVGVKDNAWQAIPTLWILEAIERGRKTPKPELVLRSVGVDVAHGGDDRTAIAKLYGNWFDDIIIYEGYETPDGKIAAQKVVEHMESYEADVFVDGIGYGASCATELQYATNINSHIVNNASASNATDSSGMYGFINLRAESYWALREALNPESGMDICLPDDRELRIELAAPRYTLTKSGYKIEPKQDIVKRLGRSPDKADAIVMAWHGCNMPQFEMDFI